MSVDVNRLKEHAALVAVEFVRPGMVVGLGHGSTAGFAIRRIAELVRAGDLDGLLAVPCSRQVEEVATRLGIRLTSLDDHPTIDVTIDGADEVDPDLNLIKGGGGALLREKIVAQASLREVIIVDESKLSPMLGTRWSVPIEVVSFGWTFQAAHVRSLGGEAKLRRGEDGAPYTTDQGNLVLDCHFGPISDPGRLAAQLEGRAGIVEHGLFLGLATDVIVAGAAGVRHLTRTP